MTGQEQTDHFETNSKLNAIHKLNDEIRRQQVQDDIDRNGYVLKPVQGEKIA